MSRRTFADVEYEGKKKQTRREKFLGRMEALIPWQRPAERIRPYYPQAGRGRRRAACGRGQFSNSRSHCAKPAFRRARTRGFSAARSFVSAKSFSRSKRRNGSPSAARSIL